MKATPKMAQKITEDTTAKAAKQERIAEVEGAEFVTMPSAPAVESEEDFPEDYPDYYDPHGVILPENINISSKREDTRGRLAIIYTVATFLMFVFGFLVSILDAAWRQVSVIDNLSVILPLLSGIFLGSLGFVLGYYFRKSEDE